MTNRLFAEFEKNNTAFKHRKFNQDEQADLDKFCIKIPLKNSQNLRAENIKINEEFIKVIEHEYAVKYLEQMGTTATNQAIQRLLKTQPLSSCEIVSGWNNSGALADVLYIYPLKKDKKTFDANKEELGFATKSKVQRKQTITNAPTGKLTEEQKIALAQEEYQLKSEIGLIEDKSNIDVNKITKNLIQMDENLVNYKKLFENLTVAKMRQELADEALEKKWKELNMGIEQWKHKYLYPFGNIEPIPASSVQSTQASTIRGGAANRSVSNHHQNSLMSSGTRGGGMMHPSLDVGYNNPSKHQDSIYSEQSTYLGAAGPGMNDSLMYESQSALLPNQNTVNTDAFTQMTQQKYLFPADQITNRDWFVELQKPLNITVADIRRDFTKFVKDFPVDIIPHTSDEELQERNQKHKMTMVAAIRRNPRMPNARIQSNSNDLADVQSHKSSAAARSSQSQMTAGRHRPNTNPNHFSQSLHYATKQIATKHIHMTFNEIQSDRIARLTGLVSHFVYWCVFGHINQMPLDEYHLKQLFISIAQSTSQLQVRYSTRKERFATFIMPMILLAIRVEMEVILKVNYPQFMDVKANEERAMRFVNGVITELLDPKIYYSRFSFLESGKEAIDKKFIISTKNTAKQGPVEDKRGKYYTRSALVKNLIPKPSDGRVRALFKETAPQSSLIRAGQASLLTAGQSRRVSPQKPNYYSNVNSTMVRNTSAMHVTDEEQLGNDMSMAIDQANQEHEKEMQMLDLINRVQMFQIASSRINQKLLMRKKEPAFNLQFTETFDGQEEAVQGSEMDEIQSMLEGSEAGSKNNLSMHHHESQARPQQSAYGGD